MQKKKDFKLKYSPHLLVYWTLIVFAALGYNVYEHHQEIIRDATNEARTYYELNLAYRAWTASVGGVYAPVEKIKPNPYLHIAGREVITDNNKQLTLVNPAYLTRLVFDVIRTRFQNPVINRITSLKYLNPDNAPKEWEKKALLSFEKGQTEVVDFSTIDNKHYLTLMKPFVTEASCLKCHGHQGYKVGDIRGGMSIAVPLAPYYSAKTTAIAAVSGTHLLIWFIGCVGLMRFSLGRYRQIQKIRQSEDSLANAQRIAHLGNWDWDIATGALLWSDEVYRIFGHAPQEFGVTYEVFLKAVHETDRQNVIDAVNEALDSRKPYDIEHRIVLPDGAEKTVHVQGEAEYDSAGKPRKITGTVQDITTFRKLESQLLHSQKMEAIGKLAGGVAHDFNNMLTAIIGYGSLMQMKIEKDSPLRPYLEQILSSAEKSANLTHQLLAFSRKQKIDQRETNINELIRNMEKLLLRLIGEDIALKTQLTEQDIYVMVDPGQIEQVLMNLCTNARDAMPNGGLLSIILTVTDVDSSDMRNHGLEKTGRYVLISVSDTGRGMDEKTKEQIFEPFFTTKETGKGTGLGLSIAYGIIRQHRGSINVYSEPGRGTTFRIYLPLIETSVSKAEAPVTVFPTGGTETILIAEDNENVRELTATMLREFGYDVLEAVNGEEAVRLFEENRDRIDLVLLDVIMPKKNGKEAFDEIKKINPDASVIFTSGYTADVLKERCILDDGIIFMSKPVTPNVLLMKIREILDRR